MTSSYTSVSRISGTKLAPMPWILCGPGWPPLRIGDSAGLDGDDLHAGLALLEHLADAGDRAAGADAGDEDVDLRRRCRPDLLGRRACGGSRGWRVGELAGEDGALALGDDLLGLGDGALHALAPGVRISSAPKARSSARRSLLIVSGIVSTTL
jgi:hypothetical protein